MPPPTAPFSTNQQVAYLVKSLFPGQPIGNFTDTTIPTSTHVNELRSMRAAHIQMAFSAVGYVIPFQEYPGEEWPDHQTTFLSLLEALAVAGDIANVMKPAPATAQSNIPAQNVYLQQFEELLNQIRTNGMRFRANYYSGTLAEKILSDPIAPITDFGMGYTDPQRYLLLEDATNKLMEWIERHAVSTIDWDYMEELRNTL